MCGFVGVICNEGKVYISRESILAATDLLTRRGPDDRGVWMGEGAGFGHRRLAVIDLSAAGHQPMTTRDGRYVLVFNGEIYNHNELRMAIGNSYPWSGHSDSEVVLASYILWGAGCVERFHGMFAFTIWDTEGRTLFVARDRMGVKPLYYYHSGQVFAFASRPRALHALVDRRKLKSSAQALRYYLEGGYIPAPFSFHEAVKKLPPAHYLLFSEDGLDVKRYWGFDQMMPDNNWEKKSEEDLLDELDEIVARCVRSRMISDVPLGAFLSGGIDSSLVVAMMAKNSQQPVRTFTVGFEEEKYDESRHAKAVAAFLETKHHCETLSVDSLLGLLPEFVREFDEPFYDSSAFPTMAVSRLARQYVTVSLSGDGGDELFGGYHYYLLAEKINSFYDLPGFLRQFVSSMVNVVPGHRMKLLAQALRQRSSTASFAFMRSVAKDFTDVLMPEVLEETTSYVEMFSQTAARMDPSLRPAEVGMRLDSRFTLPDDYLQKVDVGSMSYSLESREPLLDQELVEWAMRLPLAWKIKKGGTKYLLRKLAYRYIPRTLLDRPKQGFAVPIDSWLRNQLRDWALERIHDKRFYTYLPVNQSRVLELFKLHESGKRDVHPLLWAMLMLIEYCYQHESIR